MKRQRESFGGPSPGKSKKKTVQAVRKGTKVSKPSPFESITPKAKFSVLNRKVQGAISQNASKSRSDAISKRKESLLVDFESMKKANTFDDKRIGENEQVSEDDKYLHRFQQERRKQLSQQSRKNKFSLHDDDDDELTHMGISLSTAGAMNGSLGNDGSGDDGNFDEDVDDRGRISSKAVKENHFGGGALTAGGVKDSRFLEARERAGSTKKDIMADVIMKSKAFKMDKQDKMKDQFSLVSELDGSFGNLRELLDFKDQDDFDNEKHEKVLLDGPAGKLKDEDEEEGVDAFHAEAIKLGEEARARASEKMKKPDQIATEERDRLVKLEKDRLRRMKGTVETWDDELDEKEGEQDGPGNSSNGGFKQKRKAFKDAKAKAKKKEDDEQKLKRQMKKEKAAGTIQGDDLDSNFDIDDEFMVAGGESDELDDSDGSDDDDKGEKEDDDGNESDDDGEDGEDSDDDGISQPSSAKKRKLTTEDIESAAAAIPFVLPAPKKYVDFKKLLVAYKNHNTADDLDTIIRRIRVCHHISLGPENKLKMETFFAVLLEHFQELCKNEEIRLLVDGERGSLESVQMLVAKLGKLATNLFEMSEVDPRLASKLHREAVEAMSKSMRDRATGATVEGDQKVANVARIRLAPSPSSYELLFLKYLSHIFPTSDYRHNVLTPCLLLMSESLATFPVRGPRDVTAGLFISSLLLSYTQSSKRLVPEVLSYLHDLLVTGFALPPTSTNMSSEVISNLQYNFLPGSNIWENGMARSEAMKCSPVSKGASPAASIQLAFIFCRSNSADVWRTSSFLSDAFESTLRLIQHAARICDRLPSFPELFSKLQTVLVRMAACEGGIGRKGQTKQRQLTPSQAALVLETYDVLARIGKLSSKRRPLVTIEKVHMIKEYSPEFNDSFRPGQDLDPDKERKQVKQLTKKLKRDKKGAMRELRRDTHFIATEKQKQLEKDSVRQGVEKKEVRAMLARDEQDTNLKAKMSKKSKKRGIK